MFTVKIHLDPAEYAVVSRYATKLDVSLEDIAYAGLDYMMSHSQDTALRTAICETKGWRAQNLPSWADTERSVHAYEGGPDDQPEERLQF